MGQQSHIGRDQHFRQRLRDVFVLAGTQLPINSIATYDAFETQINSFGSIPSGSFAPNQRIGFSEIPGIRLLEDPSISEGPDVYQGDDSVLPGLGSGKNYAFTSNGNDTIAGGSGNDTLNGGTGTNFMHGGAGVDTFVSSGTAGTILD